jgi:glycosyltransferase involved in cell wall biosynthesis
MNNRILIGPTNKKDIGSIPTLNRAFIDGLSKDYEFIPLHLNRKHGKSKLANFNVVNLYYFVKQYFKLIYLVIVKRPKIVHYAITSFWNFEKSLLFLNTAKLLGAKKVIGHIHGGSFNVFIDNLTGIRRKISWSLFNNLDAVIVASEFWKEYLEGKNIKTLIKVVNNPINSEYVNKIQKNDEEQRNRRFLFLGALGKRKGVYDLIESSKEINDNFKLDLIGSEDRKGDLDNIQGLIGQHNLSSCINVILSEKLSLADKTKYFSENEVFLFPTHNENFPLVIIEAACAGIPIITTPVGAIPEFFTHMENIYFIEPGNIKEIQNAIEFMLTNKEERERLGKAARKVYEEKLSEEKIMKQLDDVYRTLLN